MATQLDHEFGKDSDSEWVDWLSMYGGEGLSVAKTAVDNLYREGPYYY